MSLLLAFALVLALAALTTVGLELARAIRGDGYGHRPTPRSMADDAEHRDQTLARLAR